MWHAGHSQPVLGCQKPQDGPSIGHVPHHVTPGQPRNSFECWFTGIDAYCHINQSNGNAARLAQFVAQKCSADETALPCSSSFSSHVRKEGSIRSCINKRDHTRQHPPPPRSAQVYVSACIAGDTADSTNRQSALFLLAFVRASPLQVI